jgi:hypothetical protein
MRIFSRAALLGASLFLASTAANTAVLQEFDSEEQPIAQEGDPVPDELLVLLGFAPELESQIRFDQDDFGSCISSRGTVQLFGYEYHVSVGCVNKILWIRRLR